MSIYTQTYNSNALRSACNLVQIFLKQKSKTNKQLFLNLAKKYSKFNEYRSVLMIKSLNKIILKDKQTKNSQFFSYLILNKINFIKNCRTNIIQLNIKSKKSSIQLTLRFFNKLLHKNINQSFDLIKNNGYLIYKQKLIKVYRMINAIKRIQTKYFFQATKLIKIQGYFLIQKIKNMLLIQDFYLRKKRQNLMLAINLMKNKPMLITNIQTQSINAQTNVAQIQSFEAERQQLKEQLNELKKKNTQKILKSQKQMKKTQEQHESSKFSHDLISQNNIELREQINERQKVQQIEQKKSNNNKVLSQKCVWKSIFTNLINHIISQQSLNPQTILQKLTSPILPMPIYLNISQLQQQNKILTDLLNAYKQNFPQPSAAKQENSLDVLGRNKKFMYQVLQCVTRWTDKDNDELGQIRLMLDRLK